MTKSGNGKLTGEEEYFYNLNKELIENKRSKLDVVRVDLATEMKKESFWLRCPKCDDKMEEENMIGILIDRCSGCDGIYFDKGELETLLEASERKGFFSFVKRKFNH